MFVGSLFSQLPLWEVTGQTKLQGPKGSVLPSELNSKWDGLQGSEKIVCTAGLGAHSPAQDPALSERGHLEAAPKDQHGSAWSADWVYLHRYSLCTVTVLTGHFIHYFMAPAKSLDLMRVCKEVCSSPALLPASPRLCWPHSTTTSGLFLSTGIIVLQKG